MISQTPGLWTSPGNSWQLLYSQPLSDKWWNVALEPGAVALCGTSCICGSKDPYNTQPQHVDHLAVPEAMSACCFLG